MKVKQCKDCEKRFLGCHGSCPEYIEFKQKREHMQQVRRQEKSIDDFVFRDVPTKRNRKVLK